MFDYRSPGVPVRKQLCTPTQTQETTLESSSFCWSIKSHSPGTRRMDDQCRYPEVSSFLTRLLSVVRSPRQHLFFLSISVFHRRPRGGPITIRSRTMHLTHLFRAVFPMKPALVDLQYRMVRGAICLVKPAAVIEFTVHLYNYEVKKKYSLLSEILLLRANKSETLFMMRNNSMYRLNLEMKRTVQTIFDSTLTKQISV